MTQKNQKNEVRICFGVDPDLKERLKNKVPWGDVKKIFVPITERLVDLLETQDPELIKAGIISKKLSLEKIIDYKKDETETS